MTFVLISRPCNLVSPVPESLGFMRYLPGLKNGRYSESDWKRDTLKTVIFNICVISLGWLEIPRFAPERDGRIYGHGDFQIVCFLDQT